MASSNTYSVLSDDFQQGGAPVPRQTQKPAAPKPEPTQPKQPETTIAWSTTDVQSASAEGFKTIGKPRTPKQPVLTEVTKEDVGGRGRGGRGRGRGGRGRGGRGRSNPGHPGREKDRQSGMKTTRNEPPRKGGAGKASWGKAGDEEEEGVDQQNPESKVAVTEEGEAQNQEQGESWGNADTFDAAAQKVLGAPKVEENKSLDDYETERKKKQEELNAKIGGLVPRKLEGVIASEEKKEEEAAQKAKEQRAVKKADLASELFPSQPRQRNDDDEGRRRGGRGRGGRRGGRGRGGRGGRGSSSPASQSQAPLKTTDFPDL
eukprot:TRINITY_DN1465_c0_g1_i2.p1 TRINITY_DN1465_c0_g1~~TRINITY_DN1465_c0_g1_i2.p1  ORF type:complete len:318 (+),score=137.93 TRINITY_DN1465_c0_g1_i2:619-1572(+)